jgi:DNA modification methylase
LTWEIREGDCRAVLAEFESESVQCVVTSPPYWGLRDYGIEGQLGLEPTPEEYVTTMVEVFREVRRVLRKDGAVWLNMGDGYASGEAGRNDRGRAIERHDGRDPSPVSMKTPAERQRTGLRSGLKPKDLVGIPWRLAFALQADGWYLRSDIIWAKRNPMPESVTDRPTKSHEYVFLLTKSARYFYDADAVREPPSAQSIEWNKYRHPRNGSAPQALHGSARDEGRIQTDPAGRNLRSVWNIATEPFPEAHFATFPKALVEPCIKAGTKTDDMVLDPFAGSGTVGVVALRLGRSFIGIELSPTYAEMARRRIENDAPLFNMDVT